MCSFHREVDIFLRSSNSEQLQFLQQIEAQNDLRIVNLLREHEYIVYAVCELRAVNKVKVLPKELRAMGSKIIQLDNQAWLTETI